jgi:hypothetical protein
VRQPRFPVPLEKFLTVSQSACFHDTALSHLFIPLTSAFGNTFAVSRLRVGYCWSFYFHATRLLLLRWILEIFGPSMTACARHNLQHLGVGQQQRVVFADTLQPIVE